MITMSCVTDAHRLLPVSNHCRQSLGQTGKANMNLEDEKRMMWNVEPANRTSAVPLPQLSRRLAELLLVYYFYGGGGYFLINWHIARYQEVATLQLSWDSSIPFSSKFVWVYVLHYVLPVLMVVLLPGLKRFNNALLSYFFVFTVAFAVFIVYPVRMIRPNHLGPDFSDTVLGLIYSIDEPTAVFPSVHVALSLLTGLIVTYNDKRLGSVFLLTALGIALSTLYVKQHWIADILAGAALGIIAFAFVYCGVSPRLSRARQ